MAEQGSDVASTLNELERKLRALESDLQSAFADQPSPDQPSPADIRESTDPSATSAETDPEQIVAKARRHIAELRAELDELARTREREQAAYDADIAVSGYSGAAASAIAQPPMPPIAPMPPPMPPLAQALTPELTIQHGAVVIEAGFFRDVTTLSAFEQSIARVPGVITVHVRTLDQGRAVIDVQLSHPIALGAELTRYAPLRFTVTTAGPQHLMLAIAG